MSTPVEAPTPCDGSPKGIESELGPAPELDDRAPIELALVKPAAKASRAAFSRRSLVAFPGPRRRTVSSQVQTSPRLAHVSQSGFRPSHLGS